MSWICYTVGRNGPDRGDMGLEGGVLLPVVQTARLYIQYCTYRFVFEKVSITAYSNNKFRDDDVFG